jgi:hypothetical protein
MSVPIAPCDRWLPCVLFEPACKVLGIDIASILEPTLRVKRLCCANRVMSDEMLQSPLSLCLLAWANWMRSISS